MAPGGSDARSNPGGSMKSSGSVVMSIPPGGMKNGRPPPPERLLSEFWNG